MKYFILFIFLGVTLNAATLRSLRLERVYQQDGTTLDHVNCQAYTDQQSGQPYVRDLTTQAQYNKLAQIANFSAFQLSKMPDKIWIFYNADGTIERIDHQVTGEAPNHITQGADVPSNLVTGIQNLKIFIEGLLP